MDDAVFGLVMGLCEENRRLRRERDLIAWRFPVEARPDPAPVIVPEPGAVYLSDLLQAEGGPRWFVAAGVDLADAGEIEFDSGWPRGD